MQQYYIIDDYFNNITRNLPQPQIFNNSCKYVHVVFKLALVCFGSVFK